MNTLTMSASRSTDGSAVPFTLSEPCAYGVLTVGEGREFHGRATDESPRTPAPRVRDVATTNDRVQWTIAESGMRRWGA